jgi:hypothetical protein
VFDAGSEARVENLGAVTGAVIGQHPVDGDAAGLKRGVGPLPEACGGFLAFVGEDL